MPLCVDLFNRIALPVIIIATITVYYILQIYIRYVYYINYIKNDIYIRDNDSFFLNNFYFNYY